MGASPIPPSPPPLPTPQRISALYPMRPYLHSHSSPHDRAPPSPSLPTFRDRRFSMPSSYEKPTSHVAQRSTLSVYKQDVQEERKPETKSPASKSFPSITNLTRKLSSHSRGRESPMEPSNETKNTLPPIGSPNQSDRGTGFGYLKRHLYRI